MTPADFQTKTWSRLTKLLQTRLQELRELNDKASNTPDKTSLIRGQISEVKRLLALPQGSARAADLPLTGDVEHHDEWEN